MGFIQQLNLVMNKGADYEVILGME